MKKYIEIDNNKAKRLIYCNAEYLVWADGTNITEKELIECFTIRFYNSCANLEHKQDDFRIENIIYV